MPMGAARPVGLWLAIGLVCLLQQRSGRSQDDPELHLWKVIKKSLLGPDGAEYFETSMKGAMVPPVHGKVVRLDPAVAPRIVVLAVEDGTTADATLKFDHRLPGKVKAGTELIFEGVPESYTASPFMIVFDVNREHLQGWPKASR